jgi:hypothetical protein
MATDTHKTYIKDLENHIAGFSKPSKMPCIGWSLPAFTCKIGQMLRDKVKNSVCASCYACKGNYLLPVVKNCLEERLDSLSDLESWTDIMITLINANDKGDTNYFRWHDSGDIQSTEHFNAIVNVAKGTPTVQHWLPTKEYKIVKDWIKENGELPSNLTVRISAYIVGKAPKLFTGVVGSGVDCNVGFSCKAPQQEGKCLECRACWNKNVEIINYHKH